MNTWPLMLKFLYRYAIDDIQMTADILAFADGLEALAKRLRRLA